MLLRSSSTPVLGSLLPAFSDSPNNSNHHQSELHGSTHKHTPNSKLSCTNQESKNVRKSFFHSPSIAEIKSTSKGFRRVQSEGNLEELADASHSVDEFIHSKKSARRTNCCCTLEAIPSFSIHHLGARFEDDDDSDDEEEIEDEEELELEDNSNPLIVENLVLAPTRTNVNDYGSLGFEGEGKMYLATGLGVSGVDFDGGDGGGGSSGGGGKGSYRPVNFGGDGGDNGGVSMEGHYKRMLEENPGNPLFLRNYAQFLYQKKGDLERAEEYYSRAILADPEDGEILSQYARLIWELHRDKNRAANYFERAIWTHSKLGVLSAIYMQPMQVSSGIQKMTRMKTKPMKKNIPDSGSHFSTTDSWLPQLLSVNASSDSS